MAPIKCPECGKEISSPAKSCPYCGCPIKEIQKGGTVKIILPYIQAGAIGLFFSHSARITAEDDTILWSGRQGQTAVFEIGEPQNITIDLGSLANPLKGYIEPHKKYSCIQDMGLHWIATYILTEVDAIDSET